MNAAYRCVLVSISVIVGSSSSFGQVTNVSQNRSISVITNAVNQTESTILVGQWDRSLETSIEGFAVRGTAEQSSLVSAARFSASGSVFGRDDVSGFFAGAASLYEARFQVNHATPYTLTGTWFSSVDYTNSAGFRFERISPDPQVIHLSRFNFAEAVTSGGVNIGGLLPAGEYRMFADVVVSVGGFGINTGSGQFNFDLQVPTPGAITLVAASSLFLARRRRDR